MYVNIKIDKITNFYSFMIYWILLFHIFYLTKMQFSAKKYCRLITDTKLTNT